MARIQCPSCGAVVEMAAVRHAADEFCPSCDFPLFWATHDDAPPESVDDDEVLAAAVRRRPGAAGRQVLAGEPCPVCHELNSSRAVYCNRCGADMHPPPPPPAPVVEEPVLVAAPPVAQAAAPPRRRWWLVGLVVLGLLLVVQLVVVLARL